MGSTAGVSDEETQSPGRRAEPMKTPQYDRLQQDEQYCEKTGVGWKGLGLAVLALVVISGVVVFMSSSSPVEPQPVPDALPVPARLLLRNVQLPGLSSQDLQGLTVLFSQDALAAQPEADRVVSSLLAADHFTSTGEQLIRELMPGDQSAVWWDWLKNACLTQLQDLNYLMANAEWKASETATSSAKQFAQSHSHQLFTTEQAMQSSANSCRQAAFSRGRSSLQEYIKWALTGLSNGFLGQQSLTTYQSAISLLGSQ